MKRLFFLLLITVSSSPLLRAQICQVTITRVVTGNQVQYFGASPDNPATWSWFFNGGTPMTSTQQNPVVTYPGPGTYICALSVSGGPNNCSPSLSRDVDTVIIATTGIQEGNMTHLFQIRPASSGNAFIIDSDRGRDITVSLYDINGRNLGVIYNGEAVAGTSHFRIPEGVIGGNVYFLEAESGGERRFCRFMRINP